MMNESQKPMNKAFWFDMDGVLAIYEREAYINNYKHGQYIEKTPLYIQPDKHYYRYVRPDEKMLKVVELLCNNSPHHVCVITNISADPYIGRIQTEDKKYWLHKYCPYINTDTQFFTTSSTKNEIASAIIKDRLVVTTQRDSVNGKMDLQLTPVHVLIDDFNRNLINWRNAGGTAVKYINGINTPDSFDGIIIPHTEICPCDIASFLSLL